MSQDYDKILKENIEPLVLPLARKVLNLPEPEGLLEIADDLQRTIERRPDFLKIVTDKNGHKLYILQIEFQTDDDPKMVYRMLEYAALLIRRYELPVKQYVFYIGEKYPRMITHCEIGDVSFQFGLRSIGEVSYREFLATNSPEEAVLAILADLGDTPPETAVTEIVVTLQAVTHTSIELGRYLKQVEILSKLRNLQEVFIKKLEAMPLVYDLKTDIRYLQGMREGISEGAIQGFREGLQEGRQEGKREVQEQTVRKLLASGVLTVQQIAEAVGVLVDYVESLRTKL